MAGEDTKPTNPGRLINERFIGVAFSGRLHLELLEERHVQLVALHGAGPDARPLEHRDELLAVHEIDGRETVTGRLQAIHASPRRETPGLAS